MDTHTSSTLSIHEAAAQGDLDRVKWLIETGVASVNEIDETTIFGYTVLHHAAGSGQKKVVEFLLSQGATLDVKNNHNFTPLSTAIEKKHADITQLLLEKGADPHNISDVFGSHLHIAAKAGCPTIINQLLQYGASPNVQAHMLQYTALHTAVLKLQPNSILALYPHVDATLRDLLNETPLEMLIEFIAEGFSKEVAARLMPCLYAFLCAGEDINEELISQTVTTDQLPKVMESINNAINFKEEMENRLGYLGSDIVTHILLQAPREREALLNGKDELEQLGCRQLSTIYNFLFASKKERKEFLFSQRLLKHPTRRKATQSNECSILDLPPELLQICLENLLNPTFYLDDIKRSIEQKESTTYTRPSA